jgi:hypothetical protein
MSFARLRFALLALLLALAAPALAQTTVTLQQGLNSYGGATDSWVLWSSGANLNKGADTVLQARTEFSDSAMVRFKIFAAEGGPVPDGASITSATLSLYMFWGPDGVFKASRLLKDWNESQVTWNQPVSGSSWTQAGAMGSGSDYAANADGQGSVVDGAANGCNTAPEKAVCWLNINVTSGVQALASNPASNFGWKIAQVSSSNPGGYKNFNSKENTNFPALRPKLTVTYSTVEPTGCNGGALRPYDGAPVNGSSIAIAASGATTFEAEHFNCGGEGVAYHDNVAGNAGNANFRTTESVDIVTSAEGNVVNNFENGEWLTYAINVAQSGTYDLAIRASNNYAPGLFRIEIDGVDVTGNVPAPMTNGWDLFQWFTKPGVSLGAGQHVLKLMVVQQYFNVNQLRLTKTGDEETGDCAAGGLNLCVRFEAAETQFAAPDVNSITTQSLGSNLQWFVQNQGFGQCNGDRADDASRIALVDGGRDGSKAIKFTTLSGDNCVHGSNPWERSEVSFGSANTGAVQGAEQWWAHSVLFPAQFHWSTAAYSASLFFQFHGETGSQPNINLNVFSEPGTNRMIIRSNANGAGGSGGDGRQYFYSVHGTYSVAGQCLDDSFQTGVWYDFVHRLVWSYTNGGVHEIWMRKANGAVKKVLERTGINTLYSGDRSYLKFGTYHDPVGQASSVIHDRVRRGNSFASVAMPDFTLPGGGVVPCSY